MIIWNEIAVQTSTSLLFFVLGCATTVCGQLVLLSKVHSHTEELVDASATVPGEVEEDDDGGGDFDAVDVTVLDLNGLSSSEPVLIQSTAHVDMKAVEPERILIRRADTNATSIESIRLLAPSSSVSGALTVSATVDGMADNELSNLSNDSSLHPRPVGRERSFLDAILALFSI